MGRTGSFSCMKVLILVGNLLIMAIGIAAIATGIYTKIEIGNNDLGSSGTEAFNLAPIGLILVGFAVVFLGALGLWGAAKESRGSLGFYLLLTAIIILAQFALGLYGAVKFFNHNANNTLSQVLEESWDAAPDNSRADIEKAFKCCGWSNTTDNPGTSNCTYTISCETQVVDFIHKNLVILVATLIGFLIIQVFWWFLSCCFFRAVGRVKREENQSLLKEALYVHR